MSFKDFVAWIVISLALFLVGAWAVNHYWIALGIVAALAAVVGGLLSVRVVRWYICWLMAQVNFIFTEVPEGRFKVVTRFGGHKKTLLNKEGYKLAEADELDASGNPVVLKGDIVPLKPGEQAPPTLQGGLFLIGWPGIDRLFATNMKFLKSLSSGSIESHSEELQDTFYAKVDYNYAILFRDCEDKNNLPLIGHATLLANVTGPYRSLFRTKNFYETMVGLVLPSIRECLKGYSYDELKDKDDLDEIIWQALNEPNPKGRTKPGSATTMSVREQLYEDYGVEIIALRIVNVDPADAKLRELTLIKYRAEREADAADAVRRKEAIEAAGPLALAMDEWVATQVQDGETVVQAKERLQKSGAYAKHETHAKDLILAYRGNLEVARNEFGSPDGTPLPSGLQYLSVGGGQGAGVLFSGKRRKQRNDPGKGKGPKKPKPVADEEDDEEDDDDEEEVGDIKDLI
jgi:hypothetical protein